MVCPSASVRPSLPVSVLLSVFVDDVLEEREQRPLAALVPALHEASVAFAGGWSTPAEVLHLVRTVFLLLSLVQKLLLLLHLLHQLLLPLLLLGSCQQLSGQLAPHLSGEGIGRVALQAVGGEDLDWAALSPGRLPPAEVLHGVGALGLAQLGGWGEAGGQGLRLELELEVGISRDNGGLGREARATAVDALLRRRIEEAERYKITSTRRRRDDDVDDRQSVTMVLVSESSAWQLGRSQH